MRLWQYIVIGNSVFSALVIIVGWIVGRAKWNEFVNNHLKHMQDNIEEIKEEIKKITDRCQTHGERIAHLEGTKK